jgi:hypothetical protein
MNKTDKICKFCKKAFSSERTLASHMCVKKKRWADKDNIASRLGLRVFQEFYYRTTSAKKYKTLEDFIDNRFYIDFVKFGRYLVELDPIDSDDFVTYLIENGVKLRDWKEAYVYACYLEEKMKSEPVYRAVERSLATMENWAKENSDIYSNFFKKANINEVVYFIRSGKISPWVFYLAPSADRIMSNLNEDNIKIIEQIIDPIKWQVIFMSRREDTERVRETLLEAGL